MAPLRCPQDRRNNRFFFRKKLKTISSQYSIRATDKSQDTRELPQDSAKIFTTVQHIHQDLRQLKYPEQTFRTDLFLLTKNPQTTTLFSENPRTFSSSLFQNNSIPFKQTASLFPVESNDKQQEVIYSSIGELPLLSNSMLITTPNAPLNQTTSNRFRAKEFFFNPLNRKTECQTVQCLALDFQNTLQHNSSANKNKTKQTKLQMHSD